MNVSKLEDYMLSVYNRVYDGMKFVKLFADMYCRLASRFVWLVYRTSIFCSIYVGGWMLFLAFPSLNESLFMVQYVQLVHFRC